jgi:ABC-type methionine transport system permease subunit
MKNKNKWKLLLDAAMVVVFSILYSKSVISLAFHEVAGLVILGVALIHVLLNWKWVVGMTKKIFSKNLPAKTRVLYIVDFLLLVCVIVMIVTSLLISKKLFGTSIGNHSSLNPLHFCTAAIMLILIGVHLGLHFSYIKTTLAGPKTMRKIVLVILLVLAAACCVYGVYTLANSSFIRWISAPFSAGNAGAGHGPGMGTGMGPGNGMGKGTPPAFSFLNLVKVFCQFFSVVMLSAIVTYGLTFCFGRKKQMVHKATQE